VSEITQVAVNLKPGLTETDAAQALSNLRTARLYMGQARRELEAAVAENQGRASRVAQLRSQLESVRGGLADYYMHGLGDDQGPETDYANGILRGWTRSYTKHFSVFFSVPAPGYTKDQLGPVPSVQEWNDFDQQASSMGVGQAEVGRRLAAARAGQQGNFFQKTSQAIRENPIADAGRSIDKAVFRPVTGQIAKAVGPKVYGLLKQVAQYGSMALDLTGVGGALVGPGGLPFLKGLLGTVGQVPVVGKAAATLVTPVAGGTPTQVGSGAFTLEDKLSQAASVLGPVKFEAGRYARVFANTQGGVGQKLLAVGEDYVHEVGVCLTLVSVAAAGAGGVGLLGADFATSAAFDAINLAQTALQTGIDVTNTYVAAEQAKAAAKAAHDLVVSQAQALDAQTAELEQEIAQVKKQRAAVAAGKRTGTRTSGQSGLVASVTKFASENKLATGLAVGALVLAGLDALGKD